MIPRIAEDNVKGVAAQGRGSDTSDKSSFQCQKL